MEDKTSMCYWYPKTRVLLVPQPRTLMIVLNAEEANVVLRAGFREGLPKKETKIFKKVTRAIEECARSIGYPIFLRSDLVSAKHDYKDTCFVPSIRAIPDHLVAIAECHHTAEICGLPLKGLAVREFIPLASTFTSHWGEMPIAPERRYFIRDGEVECRHPYWPEEAIIPNATTPDDWLEKLREMNTTRKGEEKLLTKHALRIAKILSGYWSLDFALSKDRGWFFIDAAEGEKSFHPDCSVSPRF